MEISRWRQPPEDDHNGIRPGGAADVDSTLIDETRTPLIIIPAHPRLPRPTFSATPARV